MAQSKFKQFWKNSFDSMIDEESEGAKHYHHLASEFEEMAEQEEGHKGKLENMKTTKGIIEDANKAIDESVEKPGESVHSDKWDKCVADVKKDNPSANAYAVCTSQLGEESFKSIDKMNKSQLDMVKIEIEKSFGIENAGPVPNSKLAEQDLETTSKAEDTEYVIEIEYKKEIDTSWSKCSYTVIARSDDEAKNMAALLFQKEYNSIKNDNGMLMEIPYNEQYQIRTEGMNIKKGQLEQTDKKLNELANKAEDVTDTDEKYDLVDKIKSNQIKRQGQEIKARKSFKDFWKNK